MHKSSLWQKMMIEKMMCSDSVLFLSVESQVDPQRWRKWRTPEDKCHIQSRWDARKLKKCLREENTIAHQKSRKI